MSEVGGDNRLPGLEGKGLDGFYFSLSAWKSFWIFKSSVYISFIYFCVSTDYSRHWDHLTVLFYFLPHVYVYLKKLIILLKDTTVWVVIIVHSKCNYISKLEMQSNLFNNKFVAYTSTFNPPRLLLLLVTQLCLTLCNTMDCSPPGSSAHGIFQARILEKVIVSYCQGSSWSRDRIRISCASGLGRQILY